MKILKKTTALLLLLCLMLCASGCADDYEDYNNFKPAGVYIVDCINGENYETNIDDADYADKMLKEFKKLEIDTATEGEIGSAYLYMRFYDEDQSTLLIFTIYENGSCCLGEDYEEFYKVTNGRQKYIDLCDMYATYDAEE